MNIDSKGMQVFRRVGIIVPQSRHANHILSVLFLCLVFFFLSFSISFCISSPSSSICRDFPVFQASSSMIHLIQREMMSSLVPCQKLLWFTQLAGHGEHLHEYKRQLRAALMSAKTNAPSLIPHLIISDTRELIESQRFLAWWEKNGGIVHRWNLSFYDRLHSAVHEKKWHPVSWLSQFGAYLKLDIPLIIKERLGGKMEGVSSTHVLNTDADVLFYKDVNTCTMSEPDGGRLPTVGLIGRDFFGMINSGIVLYNVTALGLHHQALVEFGDSEGFKWSGLFDQTLIVDYFNHLITKQPPGSPGAVPGLTILNGRQPMNWNAGWGIHPSAAIIHFHGPKPERCLNCFILKMLEGAEGHKKRWLEVRASGKGSPSDDDLIDRWMAPASKCPWPDLPKGQICPEIYLNMFKSAIKEDQGKGYVLAQLEHYRFLTMSYAGSKWRGGR